MWIALVMENKPIKDKSRHLKVDVLTNFKKRSGLFCKELRRKNLPFPCRLVELARAFGLFLNTSEL